MRLLVTSGLPFAHGLIGLGGEISWPRPTRPGDIVHVESEVLEIRPSRTKPTQGIVIVRNILKNRGGEELQIFTGKILSFRRQQCASL
jgi:acyl dehydratase